MKLSIKAGKKHIHNHMLWITVNVIIILIKRKSSEAARALGGLYQQRWLRHRHQWVPALLMDLPGFCVRVQNTKL